MVLYTVIGRESCPFCQNAKELLKNNKQQYKFYNIEEYDKKSALWKKKPKTHVTVPVIFADNKFIGGFQELSLVLSK